MYNEHIIAWCDYQIIVSQYHKMSEREVWWRRQLRQQIVYQNYYF